MKKVLIIGAGFAGLTAAKALGSHADFSVTILDKKNHHLFQPLLYQVATAGLSPADIAVPIRSILSQHKNIQVYLEEVSSIDRAQKEVGTVSGKKYGYDYLIVAAGSVPNYFGHAHWEKLAPGPKTLEDAVEMRRRILTAFEEAEKCTDPKLKAAFMTFVIIGGGPTGVELAGAIAEIGQETLRKDFRHIDPADTQVILVEGKERVLINFRPELSANAAQSLTEMGVQIRTRALVKEISAEGISLGDEFIAAKTVLWAAGVKTSPLAQALQTPLDPQGRVLLSPFLNLEQDPYVFVLGDIAHVKNKDGSALPGLAPVAMQEGRACAKNILYHHQGFKLLAFNYVDKGQMATIGRKQAIVEFGKFFFHGTFAWLTWLIVHIFYLIGFKNRFFVFLQWTWSYLTFKKGARLITQEKSH